MFEIEVTTWLSSVAVFLYFTLKSAILARLFRRSEFALPQWVSALLGLVGFFVNIYAQSEYDRYLALSYIKGSIDLPNFMAIFILVDFVSVFVIFWMINSGKNDQVWKEPVTKVVFELLRLTFVAGIVSAVIVYFWQIETRNQMGWEYKCFRYQLQIDLASYYYDQQAFPTTVESFTSSVINPYNDAQIVLQASEKGMVSVVDTEGNMLVNGYQDLIGIQLYADNPKEFFRSLEISNATVCEGLLRLPEYP